MIINEDIEIMVGIQKLLCLISARFIDDLLSILLCEHSHRMNLLSYLSDLLNFNKSESVGAQNRKLNKNRTVYIL